jgi:antirestriction protein ArdC
LPGRGRAMNRDIYQAITERFVEQLKRGTVPGRSPGSPSRTSFRASRIAVSTHCFSAPRSSGLRSGLLSSKASTSAVM